MASTIYKILTYLPDNIPSHHQVKCMYILFTVDMCIVQVQVEDYDTILEMEIDTSENRTLQILAFYQVLKDLLQVLSEQCLT